LSQGRAGVQSRRIELKGVAVDYLLRRSPRRSLALRVDEGGVRVGAPLGTLMGAVEGFLRDHADWLLDKLAQRAARAEAAFRVADGASLPVLGEPVRLILQGRGRTARWRGGADGQEELVLPEGRGEAALLRALEARALPWFRERVVEHCLRLGVAVPPVRLTRARTRWGSCSQRSGIRLHWRLIHLTPELIDYVVAHEVAHLKEMNHSPRFWRVVEGLYPGWRDARRRLGEAARSLPVIHPGDGRALVE
jgi:predicted metal-dependent hydrolase